MTDHPQIVTLAEPLPGVRDTAFLFPSWRDAEVFVLRVLEVCPAARTLTEEAGDAKQALRDLANNEQRMSHDQAHR